MYNTALARTGSSRDPFWNFANFVDRYFGDANASETGDHPAHRSWLPPVDIYETEDAFVATLDVPGLSKKDLDVSVEDNVLTVSGERTFEKNGDSGNFRRVERAYGTFRRAFTLPSGIDVEKLNATCKDGVLTLTMPKAETAKARKISVS